MRYLIYLLISSALMGCGSDNPAPTIEAETSLYFPPVNSNAWEPVDSQSIGWDDTTISDLDQFVEASNTRALIILKDGRIAYEKYNGQNLLTTDSFEEDSYWYWASAAKTLTAFLVGRAEAEGSLSLDEATSDYLGEGWTNMEATLEEKITVRDQLSMTTGLNFRVSEPDCTESDCLEYLNNPSEQWYYHNAPYTLLNKVIEGATSEVFENYFVSQLASRIGMEGFWRFSGYNNIFYSPARSMARFGLLILAEGKWDGTDILDNPTYFENMTNSSQSLNPSYGYLWWLNGKGSFIPPGQVTRVSSDITPSAPAQMIAAMGKNGQLINIVPDQGFVVVRMGDFPGEDLIPFTFQDQMWQIIGRLEAN